MYAWVKIAARNLTRNRRRALITIVAIGLGFAAVNVFAGFTDYIFKGLQDSFIYAQANGHLTIFKRDFVVGREPDPSTGLLSEAEVKAIERVILTLEEVVLVSPRLHISGLVSNGRVSEIFVAAGRVPSDVRSIRSHGPDIMKSITLFEGKEMEDASPLGGRAESTML